MARGADACLIGRAWAFAVAARGEAGVLAILRTFKREMEVAMALTGVTKTSDITKDVLALPDVKRRLLEMGIEARPSTPDELMALFKADVKKWDAVIVKAGIEKK